MSKMLLTKEDIYFLSEKQEILDKAIRTEKEISLEDWFHHMGDSHRLALNIEFAEFLNECRDVWKWWREVPVNRERVIDEAIDVIHFIMLNLNTSLYTFGGFFSDTEKFVSENERLEPTPKLFALITENAFTTLYEQLGVLLLILNHYGFTREDILNQYEKKNKVNFERLENGY